MVDVASRRWPVLFGVFVLALSLPFWRFGGGSLGLPVNLPVGALRFVCPAVAALLLVGWAEGRAGLRRLLRRVVDFSGMRPRWWLVPVLGTAPLVVLLTYWLPHAFGRPLPTPNVPMALVPVLLCVFLISAAAEEIGWSGYLTEPTVRRFGLLGGGVLLGVVWAAWHIPGWYLQAGNTLAWTAGQFLLTVAFRVIIVWLHERTGRSLPAAILFHTTINVAEFLFPNHGPSFDPVVAGLVATVIAAALIVFDRTRWHAGLEMIRRP